jgi:N-acetyl-anhydromuramyl-L-alanine amidase AmpD
MTPKQLEASARLHAWIMSRCGIPVSEVFGHGKVALPGNGD